jgi:predicted CoA-binding protein
MPVSGVDEMLAKEVWAVVGVSADSSKFGYKVYWRLKKAGYTVYGVNPGLESLNGEKIYRDLASLPQQPEVVNFIVPPEVTAEFVSECAGRGIRYLWLQPGSGSAETLALARKFELTVLQGCVLVELRKRS